MPSGKPNSFLWWTIKSEYSGGQCSASHTNLRFLLARSFALRSLTASASIALEGGCHLLVMVARCGANLGQLGPARATVKQHVARIQLRRGALCALYTWRHQA
jgi:hypothetical protein